MSNSPFIRAGVLACLSVSPSLYAADSLQEVVVAATRTAESVDESLAAVTIITRTDIERSQVRSVPELLSRYVPGVDFSVAGGEGKVSSLFLRGTKSDHVLVLIDGVRAGSVSLSAMAWQHLSPEMIQKIEVVRGPRSSLYGADALGGIVSITTRRSKSGSTTASLGAGSFGTRQGAVGFSAGDDSSSFGIHAAYLDTDGFDAKEANNPDKDGYLRKSLGLDAHHAFSDKVDVTFAATRSTGETDYDGFGDNGDSFTDPGGVPIRYYSTFTQQNLSLAANTVFTDSWLAHWVLGESRDESEAFDGFPATYKSERTQLSWQNDVTLSKVSLLTAGLDYLDDKLDSTVDYNESSRNNVGVFAEYQTRLGAHDLQLSVRQDDNEAFGTHATGGISVGHAFAGGVRLLASYGTAFKAPTFNELYYPNFGNSNLDPETSETLELALTGEASGGRWAARLFRTNIDNLIAAVLTDPATFTYQAKNVDEARIDGLELEWGQTVANWDVNASLTLLDPVDRRTDKVLESRVKQSFKLNLDRDFGAYSLGASVLAQGKRAGGTFSAELPGYGTVDLRGTYRISRDFQLGVLVGNLLDRQYQTRDGYNTADRNVMVSVSYR
ncbi:MAG: TonB-dependent receptor domain-containing protein [bacterium]